MEWSHHIYLFIAALITLIVRLNVQKQMMEQAVQTNMLSVVRIQVFSILLCVVLFGNFGIILVLVNQTKNNLKNF